uniref:DUF4795 domain-containing protein n=1 Tax=Accipiter nisus TaxID=211598 RepID=A0A8B9MFM2_9AVES
MSPSQEPAVPWGSSGSSSASSRYVETVEALRQIGQLGHLYTALKEQVAQLEAACPVCSTDTSVQVGQLLQRYEKLQDTTLSSSSLKQDEELLKRIQATVMQVQGDYEKLSSVTGNLLDDRHQKQKDIEALFQSLERLEKEKADKEDLVQGIDVKAVKTALAGKVSRTQFDASMERLNEMIQEMLSRVMGQEQGWHQVQRQLSEEMDSKLDRLELGPFQQQLEEHWKTILEQLKEKMPQMEADDAAGIKKQLLAHLHCISCDRPLSMLHDEMELLGQDGHIYRGRRDGQLPVLMGKEGTAGAHLGRGSGRGEGDSGVGRLPVGCQFFPHPCSPWLPPPQLPLVSPARLPEGQAQTVPTAVGCPGHRPPPLAAPERRVLAQPAGYGPVRAPGQGEGTLLSPRGWGGAGVCAPSRAGWDGGLGWDGEGWKQDGLADGATGPRIGARARWGAGGGGGGAGQCGTTACMLQGGSQDPVSGCLARQVPMLPAPVWAGRAAHSQCLPHGLQGG